MRFPLSKMFGAVILVSLATFGATRLWNAWMDVRETAIWSDYQSGAISREGARQKVGDVVDCWEPSHLSIPD
jgi:hypothetical protein